MFLNHPILDSCFRPCGSASALKVDALSAPSAVNCRKFVTVDAILEAAARKCQEAPVIEGTLTSLCDLLTSFKTPSTSDSSNHSLGQSCLLLQLLPGLLSVKERELHQPHLLPLFPGSRCWPHSSR